MQEPIRWPADQAPEVTEPPAEGREGRRQDAEGDHIADPDAASPAPAPKAGRPTSRLVSLDAFRGLTILGMLLVNNVALDTHTPKLLMHAPWNGGVYGADLVFPWFLFIVGVALPYAAAAHRKRQLSGWSYAWKAIKRAALLVLFGCLIDSSLAQRPLFDLGVLQIIGLAYLAGALLYVLPGTLRGAATLALLAGHWAAIHFISFPGGAAGLFTEQRNLITYVNDTYLRQYHVAGLVSVVPTCALVLIGTLVGDLLRDDARPAGRKLALLFGAGAALAAAGWLWNLSLPFNKGVWTASYILFTAGLGALVLGALYWSVDMRQWRAWAFPLVVFGTNAIVAYVVPILVKVHVFMEWTWPAAGGHRVSLVHACQQALFAHSGRIPGGWIYTVGYVVLWWLVLYALHRKRLFLRV